MPVACVVREMLIGHTHIHTYTVRTYIVGTSFPPAIRLFIDFFIFYGCQRSFYFFSVELSSIRVVECLYF